MVTARTRQHLSQSFWNLNPKEMMALLESSPRRVLGAIRMTVKAHPFVARYGNLGAAPAAPAAAQEEGRTVADAPSRKVVRTKRMRVPADLFEQNAVFFKRALVDAGGTIRADGHNLDLYGMQRSAATASARQKAPAGRAASAFIAMRGLLEGQSISCSFIAAAGGRKPCAGSATPT
jgi:hypothetical protein